MNKKFFTLLVALLATIGMGAFAQVTVGNVIKANGTLNDRYESEKFYLLQTNAENFLKVVDGKLVTITKAELARSTYSELQAAMWTVTATPGVTTGGSSATVATYEYVNAAFGIKLSLATANATLANQPPATGTGKNVLGGDLEKWIAFTNTVNPQTPNYFYVTNTLQQVITMSAKADGEVIPAIYTDLPTLVDAVDDAEAAIDGSLTSLTAAVAAAETDLDNVFVARNDMTVLNAAIVALGADFGNTAALDAVNAAAATAKTALAALNPTIAVTFATVSDQMTLDALNAEIATVDLDDEDGAEYTAQTALNTAKAALAAYADAVDNVLVITPKFAGGNIVLSANDINTYLKKQGVYENGDFYAEEDSYFDLNMSETNTLSNPFAGELQALGVYGVPSSGLSTSVTLRTKAQSGYRNTYDRWVALTDKDGKFLVVDTTYITGTAQLGTPKLQTKAVDGFWSPTNNGRLLDSYLYQFTYNGSDNSVSIKVRAYLNKPNFSGDPTKVTTWRPALANVTNNPMTANNAYIYYNQYVLGIADPQDMNYLTNANLQLNDDGAEAVVYTWGAEDMKIDLNIASRYQAFRVPTGVYLLKVTGSSDSRNIGKYVKESLDGETEYVEWATRQNFQHMPSAQWVIESTNVNTAIITNREFSDRYNYEDRTWITYKTTKDNEFFFLGKDTLQYIPVTDITDKKQGYKYVDNSDLSSLNNFEFRYLHELAMDRPVVMKANGERMPLFVNSVDADAAKFRLEEVVLDDYGYTTTNIPTLAKLERSVYRIATFDPINYLLDDTKYYVTYDEEEKQYFLMEEDDDRYTPCLFFLKENNEVAAATAGAKEICYYTFLRANVYSYGRDYASMKRREDENHILQEYIVDKLFKGGFVRDADLVDSSAKVYVLTNADGKPYTYTTPALVNAALANFGGVALDPDFYESFYDAVADRYYIRYYAGKYSYYSGGAWHWAYPTYYATAYATSKVSVDNNTLAWTYGELADNRFTEVANSAFKVEPNNDIIYRTIGHEEDETLDSLQQQNIRIYRVNATAREYLYEDANSANYSLPVNGENIEAVRKNGQINFLGVEGKGDDVFNKATMTARYVRGTIMPQYLLMMNYKTVEPVEQKCPECLALAEAGLPVPEVCPHDINTPGYSTARVLVSLVDSINAYPKTEDKNIFRWNNLPRLAFVDAYFTHGEEQENKDSIMTIVRSALPNDLLPKATNKYITRFSQKVAAGQDIPEIQQEGTHQPVFFSFRLREEGEKQFMIESAGDIGGKTTKNSWVKVQNGVPVLVNTTFDDAYNGQAEIFDLEVSDDAATSNEGIEAGQVQVIAGQGSVTIKGAAGQQVAITNILGQSVYNGIVASDEVTVAAPAGVVVVSVAGEATKALVK